MPISVSRKHKIVLTDYPYRRDIENRLIMAQLSTFEVEVLQEILHHSLKISVESLVDILGVTLDQLNPILEKLKRTKLFKYEYGILHINKEMRKYYEAQIEKFDENFQPNMEFLQGLLNRVPIHVLPVWYSLPRTSDHIFSAILEKYLSTPKVYYQYLDDLQLEDPIFASIIRDLYQSPQFRLTRNFIIEKYGLTAEQFEEYILLLEYHLVCCLRYEKIEGQWQEIVTPFYEWEEFLSFEARTRASSIQNIKEIQKIAKKDEFGFIHDLQTVLRQCSRKKLLIKEIAALLDQSDEYAKQVADRLVQLDFVSKEASALRISDKGALWLRKPLIEQAHSIMADPLYQLLNLPHSRFYEVRALRQIEKGLRRIMHSGWVYLDSFIEGFTGVISNQEPIALKNKGKKWRYILPVYTEEEKAFIRAVVEERFFELGLVTKGIHKGKTCLCVTPFGRAYLT